MQTWCAQPNFPVLAQYMQISKIGPLHCAAVMHRCAAACAGAPTSALTATTAANNSEVFDKVLIMISPSRFARRIVASDLRKLGAGNRLGCSVPRSKVTSQSSFKRTVAKFHMESARTALPEKLGGAPVQFAAVVSGWRAAWAARAVSASVARRVCSSSPPGWMMPADIRSCIAASTVMSRSITSRRGT
jgi:hypothetical protein